MSFGDIYNIPGIATTIAGKGVGVFAAGAASVVYGTRVFIRLTDYLDNKANQVESESAQLALKTAKYVTFSLAVLSAVGGIGLSVYALTPLLSTGIFLINAGVAWNFASAAYGIITPAAAIIIEKVATAATVLVLGKLAVDELLKPVPKATFERI